MADDPVDLDVHRGMAAQRATIDRRESLEASQADRIALLQRQKELEQLLLAKPAETWPEIAARSQYLIRLFADTPQALEPRRQQLIADTLKDIEHMLEASKDTE